MRVLIDCTQVSRQKAGVGVYGINLILELVKRQANANWRALGFGGDDSNAGSPEDVLELWLLVQDDDPDFEVRSKFVNLVRVPARAFRKVPMRLLLEQIYIPWLARKRNIDVIHSLHYSFPLLRTKARRIVTVHDLTSFRMPGVHIPMKLIYYRFFLQAASRWASSVIFVSQFTQSDWRHYFPESPVREFVIPLGKGPEYRPGLPEDSIREVLQRLNINKPYVLYIGTIEPRKNLTRLVRAFSEVRRSFPNYKLVISGKKGWKYHDLFQAIAELHLKDHVIFTGYISETDKPYLLSGAEVFVYPSLYEGFGIPVLEALACGTPTLTSDSSSLREVAGDAAVLVNPESVEQITKGLIRLLSDSALRDSLRERAIVQAAKFDWERMSEDTLRVYREPSEKG